MVERQEPMINMEERVRELATTTGLSFDEAAELMLKALGKRVEATDLKITGEDLLRLGQYHVEVDMDRFNKAIRKLGML